MNNRCIVDSQEVQVSGIGTYTPKLTVTHIELKVGVAGTKGIGRRGVTQFAAANISSGHG